MPQSPAITPGSRPRAIPLAVLGTSSLAVVLASLVGGGLGSFAAVLIALISSALLSALYPLAALGFGCWLQRTLAPGLNHPWALRAGLGLAAMLTLTHLMGIAGLLTNRYTALVPVVLGIAILNSRTFKAYTFLGTARVSWIWLAATPALGVLLVAACSPPGWLWASEFGGYDTLSYHLQLPREWLTIGRVWPLEHNVYSYLPSYMEAAFLHVALLVDPAAFQNSTGDGASLAAAQFLHAWITLLAALITTSTARALLERTGAPHPGRFAPIAGALVLATPWSIVTGSMAYNEMAVVALFAAAISAALASEIPPLRRGLLVGLLIGAACGCKPTALLFCAPGAGLAMLWGRPKNQWIQLTLGACAAGLAMLAPWLLRNALAGGNPVFPQLSTLFGSAHWSPDQLARYAAGHSFEGSPTDALRLLALPEPAGPHRGLMHPQWALFAPIVAICLIASLCLKQVRAVGLLLALTLALQILAWATLTHVQSRFLVPVLVPGALAVALALSRVPVAHLGPTLGFLCVLAQSAATTAIFLTEKPAFGGPNTATLFGPALFADAPQDADDSTLGAVAFINDRLPESSRVLVVGDARVLYIRRPFAYATTWDTSPLTDIMLAHPDDPAAWAPILDEQGFTHVFVDLAELDRLALAGWAEPMLDAGFVLRWLAEHAKPIYKDEQGQRLIYELP